MKDLRGDIKLIWEFSRGYSFVLNAARANPELEEKIACEIAGEIKEWLSFNDNPNGLNWQCAMEVSIRAVNWICADTLLNGRIAKALGEGLWSYWIWNHGRAIWERLETRLISSNHYIADLMGLFFIGNVFQENDYAKQWKDFAFKEMQKAILAQTYSDGGVYEASLPYHALITEMALLFSLASNAEMSTRFRERLNLMCQVMADTVDVDGDVFQIGDNDGGRIIPLDFISEDLGRANVLQRLVQEVLPDTVRGPSPRALYPESGWYVLREGAYEVFLEFGGVGLGGLGGHAHNDMLSLNLNWRGRRILVDPGSYLYRANPEFRNKLRSSSFHNVWTINDKEQNQIPSETGDDIFSLPGSTKPGRFCSLSDLHVAIETEWPTVPGIVWCRDIELVAERVKIRDLFVGSGVHKLSCFFNFHPDVKVEIGNQGYVITPPGGGRMVLAMCRQDCRPVECEGWYSPFYGTIQPTKRLRFDYTTVLPCSMGWVIKEVGS